METIGLLGTRFTMEEDFYKGRLARIHGLQVIVPAKEKREIINRVIYNELCRGQIEQESKIIFQEIIQNLLQNGAEGILLGCTEIALLVPPESSTARLFDTTRIHANKLVNKILEE